MADHIWVDLLLLLLAEHDVDVLLGLLGAELLVVGGELLLLGEVLLELLSLNLLY